MRKIPFVLSIICFVVGSTALVLRAASSDELETREYVYKSAKVRPELNGFRIVQIADFHNHNLEYRNTSLLNALDEAKPDLILISGDMIDDHSQEADFANLETMCSHILSRGWPAFAVSGNHEAYTSESNFQRLKGIYSTNGIHWYERDELHAHTKLVDGLGLTCIGDPGWVEHDPVAFIHRVVGDVDAQMDKVEGQVDSSFVNIALCHRPELFDLYQNHKYDLVFSGHTHGNQIGMPIPFSLNQLPSKYSYGRYEENGCTMFVSAGLGYSWSLPFRVGRNAEIVVTTLKTA